jgi:signal transduction histidine kinase/CheY-like chemotaxis protein
VVTDLSVGAATGKLLTMIYVPAKASAGHVVAQSFAVDHWKRTALQPQGGTDLTVGVIDRTGRFIARNKKTDAMLGKSARPELVAAAAAADEGLIRHKTLEGVESYDAFTHSKLTGWTVAVAAPVDVIEAAANQAVMWLAAGVAIAMAVALAASLWFGRKFAQAIDEAMADAGALGHGEVPKVRTTSLREVNALNGSLVQAGRILAAEKASREALETERARLLTNEISAKEQAQAENAAKDRFLAMLGHELRNPLAAINGAAEILLRSGPHAPDFERYMGMIRRQNLHLTRIVNDLLDVSRMLSGKISLESGPLDLTECVKTCVDALSTTGVAGPSQITLQAEPVWTVGDATRMEQIVNNLLNNAIKFSPAGSPVDVKVYRHGEHAVLEVVDRGFGIDADLMSRIFEPFVQGPHLRGQVHSGLGIGLALVKQLVQLHGGDIVVHSQGHGHGSRFTVSLPASAPQIIEPQFLGRKSRPPCGDQLRVLLVEDNPDAMEATAALLELMGYEVSQASNGAEALASVRADAPDIVLMDIGLPGRSGYQVAEDIRAALPAGQRLSLIALSGYGQDHEVGGPHDLFDGFLIKPVDPGELDELIAVQRRTAA